MQQPAHTLTNCANPNYSTMPPRKNAQSTVAELSLVQLQKCFVNLPASLVNVLLNVDTVRLQHDHRQ